jgi:hypothetical protein
MRSKIIESSSKGMVKIIDMYGRFASILRCGLGCVGARSKLHKKILCFDASIAASKKIQAVTNKSQVNHMEVTGRSQANHR